MHISTIIVAGEVVVAIVVVDETVVMIVVGVGVAVVETVRDGCRR